MKFPKNNPPLLKKNMENRKIFFNKFGITPENVASGELVHGTNISTVTSENEGERFPSADGLITDMKNTYLSVTAADCLPVFLFDPKKGIVAVLHAGWKGLAKGIVKNAIDKFVDDFGSNPHDILAGIGPAICQKHFEVSRDVANIFEKYPKSSAKKNKKFYLDIRGVCCQQLTETGIQVHNTEFTHECTYEMENKYFSARRDKPTELEAMIAVIGLNS